MTWLRPFLILFLLLNSACSGCDDESFEGSAEITFITITPELGYSDVETTFEIEIVPGENTNAENMEWQLDFGDGVQTSGQGVSAAPTHSFTSPGTYSVTAGALFDGVRVGSTTTEYRVLAPVDLLVERVRGAPANVQTGGMLTVSAELSNTLQSDVIPPFDMTVYFSTSGNVNEDTLEDLEAFGVFRVEGAGPDAASVPANGRDVGFTAAVPEIPSGDYFLVAHIDSGRVIGDTDRTNNLSVSAGIVRVENTSDSAPDVEVSDVYVIPDRAFPELNTVTRGFTLRNTANVDAFDVVHRTYLSVGDDTLDDEDILISESDPQDLPAQSSVDVGPDAIVLDQAIIPNAGQEVEVYLIVVAEITDAVSESDVENNTIVSPVIVVTDQPVEGPDLVVKSFAVSPDRTFLNGSLQVETTIANEGTQNVGSFFCGIYLGAQPRINTVMDPRLDNINVPSLASGTEEVFVRNITVPGLYDPGVYYLYIVCDPENALQEPFRSNNAQLNPGPITVTDEADVDLYVASIVTPEDILDGDTYTAEIEVCVAGTNSSGATQMEVWVSSGSTVNFTLDPLVTVNVPNINPGDCEFIQVELNARCANFVENYRIGVEVDTGSVLPELNETNNRFSSQSISYTGQYCACIEDGFEPNDRVVDATSVTAGPVDAAICAAGSCDFYKVSLNAADSVILRTTLDSSRGNLRTTLYSPDGVQIIDQSSAENEQEVAGFIVPAAGEYVFSVCGLAGQRNLYSTSLDVFAQSPGIDLLARNITIPSGATFTIGSTISLSARIYNIGLSPSGTFDAEVVVSENDIIGDADDIPVTSVQISSLGAGTFRDETIPVTLPLTLSDGNYRLGIILDPGTQLVETDISNNTSISREFNVNTECFDALEPNDSFQGARDVTDGSYANLVACTSAPDYYRLCLSEGKRFTVTTTFDSALGDIDLELFNENLQLIDSSASAADVEQVDVSYVNGNQCYYARVVVIALPGQNVENTYSMDVDVEDVDPALVCQSSFEPNNSFNTASSLLAAQGQTFAMDRCPTTDVDYYFVDLTSGQEVNLSGEFAPAGQQGTLRLQVFLPNRTPGPNIETAPGVPRAELDYLPPTSGRYFVQVTVSGAQRNVTYRVEASGLSGVDLRPENPVIGPGSYLPGEEVRLGFDLRNLGVLDATAPPYRVSFGLNSNPDPANDTILGDFNSADVPATSTIPVDVRVIVPSGATAGTRYLHINVDPADVLQDANLTNNIISLPITIQ